MVRHKKKITESTGNVFEDLKLPDAEAMLAKAELLARICSIIAKRKLTQAQAATVLGIDQPKISGLMAGKLSGFSTERLFRFLNLLGRNVEIVVRVCSQRRRIGHTSVQDASYRKTKSGDVRRTSITGRRKTRKKKVG